MKEVLFYFSALLTLSIISACAGKKKDSTAQQQGPPPVNVSVAVVHPSDAIYFDEYPGTVTAIDQVTITSQVTGYVTGVYFKDGQKVSKGQLLYSIDQQVYQANLQQAQANLQVQEANLLKAQKDAERYHELDRHDAIAKQQVDNADAALEVSKKQVAAAKANVNSLRSNVSFANIRSPLTGTIGISQVKKGALITAGQTVLNTVSTDNPIAVDFAVSQQDVFRFSKLQNTKGAERDSIFTIAFGGDVYEGTGKIYLIDRAVDPQTGTIKVRLVFPNHSNVLKPGMNTTVRVKQFSDSSHTVIPYKAVTEQLGEFFVYKLADSSKVTQQQIVPGRQIGTDIIVVDGLAAGDSIVVEGVQNLKQGSVVTTTSSPPKAK